MSIWDWAALGHAASITAPAVALPLLSGKDSVPLSSKTAARSLLCCQLGPVRCRLYLSWRLVMTSPLFSSVLRGDLQWSMDICLQGLERSPWFSCAMSEACTGSRGEQQGFQRVGIWPYWRWCGHPPLLWGPLWHAWGDSDCAFF